MKKILFNSALIILPISLSPFLISQISNNIKVSESNNIRNGQKINFSYKTLAIDNSSLNKNLINFPINGINNPWIPFDLNVLKPQGMKLDTFLENTWISFDGPIIENNTIKKRVVEQQWPIKAPGELKLESTLKINKNDLTGQYESTTTSHIFNIDSDNDKPDLTTSTPWIKIEKGIDLKTMTLYVRPFVDIPIASDIKIAGNQNISINLTSPYIVLDQRTNIAGNQFYSSEDKLDVPASTIRTDDLDSYNYKSEYNPNNNSKMPFKIDIGNFYFDEASNDKSINVLIEGLMLSDVWSAIEKPKDIEKLIGDKPSPVNFNFNLKNSDIPSIGGLKDYSFDLFGNSLIDPKDTAVVTFTIEKVEDYIFRIAEINFQVYDSGQETPDQLITSLTVSPSNIRISTSPNDFSFLEMKKDIQTIQKWKEFPGTPSPTNPNNPNWIIGSDYSSNIFNNDVILDSGLIRKITNYQQIYNVMKKTGNYIYETANFKLAGANTSLFNDPFIETRYTTTSANQFRRKGIMKFSISPIKENKYFKVLQFEKGFEILHKSDQQENVNITINNELLKNKGAGYKNIDTFIKHLNEMSYNEKTKLIKITSLDTDVSKDYHNILDINELTFSKTSDASKNDIVSFNFGSETIQCLKANFKVLQNEKLKTYFSLLSNKLSFDTTPPSVLNVSLNAKLIKEKAKQYLNYQEFQVGELANIKDLINVYDKSLIEKAIFVPSHPDYKQVVAIEITLKEGNIFDNKENVKVLEVGSIPWKGQSDKSKPISVKLNNTGFATLFKGYNNASEFLEANQDGKANMEKYGKYLIFSDGDVSSILSMEFSNAGGPNEIMISLRAKEWYYFNFIGSDTSSNIQDNHFGNIAWKNENPILTKIELKLDMLLLYKNILNYKSMSKFIEENKDKFIIANNNSSSIIKLNPYQLEAIGMTQIYNDSETNDLIIKIKLNNGFYYNENDKNEAIFQIVVTKAQFEEFHNEYIKPDSKYQISIEVDHNFLAYEANKYDNLDSFLSNNQNEQKILDYIIINNEGITISAIKTIKMSKIGNEKNALRITVELYSDYYFLNTDPSIKIKSWDVTNLLWKGEVNKLVYVDLIPQGRNFLLEARNYDNLEELKLTFNTKEKLVKFISFSNGNLDAIKEISLAIGKDKNQVILSVEVLSGFYFKGESYNKTKKDFIIGNVAWKGEDLNLIPISLTINGTLLMQEAKKFNNFKALNASVGNYEFLKQLITFQKGDLSNIYNIYLIKGNYNNQTYIRVSLKSDYYFEEGDTSSIALDFLLGYIFYKDDNIQPEKIELSFNETNFYNLIKNYKDKDLSLFIQENSNKFFNTNNPSRAIIKISTNNIKTISMFNIYFNDQNDLLIRIVLQNG